MIEKVKNKLFNTVLEWLLIDKVNSMGYAKAAGYISDFMFNYMFRGLVKDSTKTPIEEYLEILGRARSGNFSASDRSSKLFMRIRLVDKVRYNRIHSLLNRNYIHR